jgi:effector-binding domain-containing protein
LIPAARAQGGDRAAAEELLARMDRARLGGAAEGLDRSRMELLGHYDLVVGRPKELKLAGAFGIWFDGARVAEEIDYGDWGKMRRGVDGDLVWEDHPAFGASVQRDADADVVRRCFGFVRYTGWREMYERAERTGEAMVDGRPQEVLAMTPARGEADTWYLDLETALPTRIDIALPGGMGLARITFGDWKAVDGVLYAHREQTVAGSASGVNVYDEIRHGVAMDQARFLVPDKVKELAAKSEAGGPEGCRIDLVDAQPTLSMRMQVKPDEIQRQLAVAFPEIMKVLVAEGVEAAGPPFTRYHELDGPGGTLEIECGIPVPRKLAGNDRVQAGELPSGRVACVWHQGSYHELKQSYDRLRAWMEEQKLAIRGAPWESYWTDPGLEPDPKKWRTQIMWPIEEATK